MSKLRYHVLWSFFNSISSIVIKIGTLIFVSWLITPQDFGLYSIGIAFVLIFSTCIQMGIPTNLAILDERKDLTGLGLIVSIIVYFLCVTLFYTTAYFFEYNISEIFYYFTLLILFQIVINILESSYKRNLDFKKIAKSEIISSLLGNGLLTIVLALLDYKVYALIYGQIAYCVIKVLYLYKHKKDIFKNLKIMKKNIKHLMSNSFFITVAELSNIATVQIQRPIIGTQINTHAAGIWSRTYQIILIQLAVVVQPIDYISLPMLAKIKEDRDYLQKVVLSLLQTVSIITLTCAIFTVILAPVLIPLILGPKWEMLVVPLQLGALIVFFRAIERILLSISRALGVMRSRALIQIIQLILVVSFLLFFSKDGIITASWALLGALFLGLLISLYTTNLTIGIPSKKIIKSILPGILLFVFTIASHGVFEYIYGYYVSLILSTIVFAIIAFLIFYKRNYFLEDLIIELILVFFLKIQSLMIKFKS